MNSRDITLLIPSLREKYLQHKKLCSDVGLQIVCTSTLRPIAVQQALYAQGREDLVNVNTLRAKCHLPALTDIENRKPVTWTKSSYHLYGVAYDFVVLYARKTSWDVKADVNKNEEPDYIEVGKMAEELGMESGMHFNDFCHVQYRGPMTQEDLAHIAKINEIGGNH